MDIIALIETVMPAEYSGEDIVIERDVCIGVNRVRDYCRLCAEICPRQAIEFQKSTNIVINQDLCSHCGACVTVCPVQAARSNWLGNERLYALLASSSAVLACAQAAAQLERAGMDGVDALTTLDCLDHIDEAALLYLLEQGDGSVDLLSADCSSCDVGCQFDMPELIREYVQTLLAAFDIEAAVNIHRVGGSESDGLVLAEAELLRQRASAGAAAQTANALDRRAAFTALKQQAVGIFGKLAAQATTELLESQGVAPKPDKKNKAAPDRNVKLPVRSEMALDALGSLLNAAGKSVADFDTTPLYSRLWGYPLVNAQKCVKCNVCSTLCPTAAITRVMDGSKAVGLDIRPYRCVQCGRCAKACAHKAIEVLQELPASLILERRTVAERLAKPTQTDSSASEGQG
jgi:ferredoxin